MKNGWLFLILIVSILACSEAPQTQNIDAKTFKELTEKTSDKIILDVRTDGEVAQGGIDGAIQIDYNGANFEQELDKLDKNKPVFVYCAVGGRSGSASQVLAHKGFKQIYNLDGGISAWRSLGYPTTTLKQ
jgi:phage shock protein E